MIAHRTLPDSTVPLAAAPKTRARSGVLLTTLAGLFSLVVSSDLVTPSTGRVSAGYGPAAFELTRRNAMSRFDEPNDPTPPALLRTDEETPFPLRLVIPTGLGEAGTLRALARVVQEVRNTLASKVTRLRQVTDEAQAQGDRLRQALCRGQLMAYGEAAGHLDQEVCIAFDIWDQDDARAPMSADIIAMKAAHNGRTITRPEFPLPAAGPGALDRLVAATRARREKFVALAVQFNCEALEWMDEAPQDGEDYDGRYYEHLGRAKAFAMAADQIDEYLAEVFDAVPAYLDFLEVHGTWLERVL